MLKQIYKNNLRVNYKDIGRGPVIILVHGFLETLDIWSVFDEKLAENFRVLSVDLPGHGKSDLHQSPYTMCRYAETIKEIMQEESIEKAFMIGHSMGGYIALAFAENYPLLLTGLCLFHSSPFADDDNKKKVRTQTIKHIKDGKKDKLCENHIRSVYANENIKKFSTEINQSEINAKKLSKEGVIASIITMRDRNDRSLILKSLDIPFLYVLGMKDNFIHAEILNKIEMPNKFEVLKLENSGHIGHIEEQEKSLYSINDFYRKFFN